MALPISGERMTAEPPSDEALLRRLVAFDTTSHKSNREIAGFICDYLDRPGLGITRHPTADCFVWLA